MSDNEVAIAIISIIFGSVVAIIFVVKLFGLIKSWINRNKGSYDEEKFDRLAKAFIQYKKDSERRLQNLEAIATDDDGSADKSSKKQLNKSQLHNTIEIDSNKKEQEKSPSGGGNLRNMLKE